MEIGSEFWLEEKNTDADIEIQEKKQIENCTMFLSGRTAIDYALERLCVQKDIKTVYFPSYCCESMLQPFVERNIYIKFYSVLFQKGKLIYQINEKEDCDIFFAMNYFGYSAYAMDSYIQKFKQRNIFVIEDSTHSWLSERVYNKNSDMVVVSLRKWFPIISGAILINHMESGIPNLIENKEYVSLKEKAMKQKAEYLYHENKNKDVFLSLFQDANSILQKDYRHYCMDKKSMDILKQLPMDVIKKQRENNAKIIYQFLKNQDRVEYLKDIDFEKDCPIFIPIFLNKIDRDKLRKYLIEKEVYLPIHWPIPSNRISLEEKQIYYRELSLVCDQRYTEKDIQGYLKILDNKEDL